jgi:hypothetical protein
MGGCGKSASKSNHYTPKSRMGGGKSIKGAKIVTKSGAIMGGNRGFGSPKVRMSFGGGRKGY